MMSKDTKRDVPVYRNLSVLFIAFFLYLNATNAVMALQSSVNFEDGMGVSTTSIYGGTSIIGYLFLTPMIIRILGLKYTIVVGMIADIILFVTNIYPSWYTLIPGNVISGLLNSNLWPAKSTYITRMGEIHSRNTGQDVDPITNQMFGIYYLFSYTSHIFGNVFSHYVLRTAISSEDIESTSTQVCGIGFCDYMVNGNNTQFSPVSQSKRYFLFGGFVAIASVATILVLCFLDQVRVGPPVTLVELFRLSMSTARHFRHKEQILLSPANFYRGLSSGFIAADYSKAFVTCALGVDKVGFSMLAFGTACGVTSLVASSLVKYVGRLPIFVFCSGLHIVLINVMFNWTPSHQDVFSYLLVVALWGIGHSFWECQIAALHGMFFPDSSDRAFSCYDLLEAGGNMLAYALSSALCMWQKLYITSFFLGLAVISHLALEIHLTRSQIKNSDSDSGLASDISQFPKETDRMLSKANEIR